MNYIKNRVLKLTTKFKTNDPFLLCELLDIQVSVAALPENIHGFYTKYRDISFVFVNVDLEECEQKAVCAHELAHAILHPTLNAITIDEHTLFSSAKFEKEADLFAANLLIPDNWEEYTTAPATIDTIAYEWSVPRQYVQLKVAAKPQLIIDN